MIDDNHCIVSSSVGPEFYVNILSFVDKDQIEAGCTVGDSWLHCVSFDSSQMCVLVPISPSLTQYSPQVLTNNKSLAVVGLLGDDVDPMVSVMKVLHRRESPFIRHLPSSSTTDYHA